MAPHEPMPAQKGTSHIDDDFGFHKDAPECTSTNEKLDVKTCFFGKAFFYIIYASKYQCACQHWSVKTFCWKAATFFRASTFIEKELEG